jgi:zinc transport system permease protein
MAACGAVIGALLGWPTFYPALALAWLSIILVVPLSRGRGVSQNAILAWLYVSAAAASLLILAAHPSAEVEVANVFFGNVLTVSLKDVGLSAAVAVPVVIVLTIAHRQLAFSLFDREAARVGHIRPFFFELLFYILLGLTVASAMRSLGVLLTFALLALPAATALPWAKRVWHAVAVGFAVAVVGLYLGFGLSYTFDLPTGPAAAAVLTVLTAVTFGTRAVWGNN